VDLDAGEIRLDAARVKTGHGRVVPLDKTPGLKALLAALKLRAGGNPFVFGASVKLANGKVRHDYLLAARRAEVYGGNAASFLTSF
jgi:hypothetical protein